MLITQDLTHPADQVKIWQPLLDTGEIASTTTAYTIDQSLPANDYRWRVRIFDGDTLVDSAGARGEQSADSTFSIQPK